jgi:hypothetical protein
MASDVCVCVGRRVPCVLSWRSLQGIGIDGLGAAVVSAALVHVPQLQVLKYDTVPGCSRARCAAEHCTVLLFLAWRSPRMRGLSGVRPALLAVVAFCCVGCRGVAFRETGSVQGARLR